MSIPTSIQTLSEMLKSCNSDIESVLKNLVQAFVSESGGDVRNRLAWLGMFAARRALPCWELYCDGDEPIRAVEAVQRWLLTGEAPRTWDPFTREVLPRFRGRRIIDCRECDTSCAADAATAAARYAATGEISEVAAALISAEGAFDQSPLHSKEEFLRWLAEVAVPIAWECRELSPDEQRAFRDFNEEDVRAHREK
jgi:hypothetical protein